ncbi:type II toxin-antitoxin system antitoxin MazE9 [soil metagenome]
MKVSVSLADEDVEFLDAYARAQGVPSRSAVVQRAVRLLRASELGLAYADAWEEWAAEPDADLWEATIADGVSPAR